MILQNGTILILTNNMDITLEDWYIINAKNESENLKKAIQIIKDILDTKYVKTDLKNITNEYKYLNQVKHNKLLNLLIRFFIIF